MAVNYTSRVGLAKPDRGEKNWDVLWRQDSDRIEARLATVSSGDPNSEGVVGTFIGQRCHDIASGYVYWWDGEVWAKATTGRSDVATDAENLNGQPASYYTNIPGRLGYTPVNRGGDLMTGALRSKSFRADTGQDEDRGFSCNTRLGGALAAFPSAGVKDYLYFNTWMNNGQRARTHADGAWFFGPMLMKGGIFDADTNDVYWHSGNDGEGSGLDADTLHGHDGTAFVRTVNGVGPSDGNVTLETVPPGTVTYYANTTPPAGWLECNGASLSTSTYSKLHAAIGYRFGGSGGTFYLPDLRGLFLRGYDNGRGMNPAGNIFGQYQEDNIKSHWHYTATGGGTPTGPAPAIRTDGNIWGNSNNYMLATRSETASVGASSPVGSSETRPKHMVLLPIIKF